MTYTDLIQRYLQLLDIDNYNEYTLQLFGSSVDTSRDKYVETSCLPCMYVCMYVETSYLPCNVIIIILLLLAVFPKVN